MKYAAYHNDEGMTGFGETLEEAQKELFDMGYAIPMERITFYKLIPIKVELAEKVVTTLKEKR